MIRAKETRKEARKALSGKWRKAIVISLIYTFIISGISILSVFTFGLLAIALIVIAPALSYGLAYSYYHLKNGKNVGYGDFFVVGFKNFGYSWKLIWNIIKRCWGYIFSFVLATIGITGVLVVLIIGTASSTLFPEDYTDNLNYESYSGALQDSYDYYNSLHTRNSKTELIGIEPAYLMFSIPIAILIFIPYLIFLIFFVKKVMLYSLTFYIAVKEEGIEAKEAALESEKLMNENIGRFFSLILSFIGWVSLIGLISALLSLIPLLGTVAFYVGTNILLPYMIFAILTFYRDLDENKSIY